jgi:hypothetical protein
MVNERNFAKIDKWREDMAYEHKTENQKTGFISWIISLNFKQNLNFKNFNNQPHFRLTSGEIRECCSNSKP